MRQREDQQQNQQQNLQQEEHSQRTDVAEQHEEEKLFKGILDKIELVGEDGKALFWIDKDLAELAQKGTTSIMEPGA